MSAPRKEAEGAAEQGARRKVHVGCVARRPVADVLEEMGTLAREDRRKISTPIPQAPRQPGRFYVTRRPPLPPQRAPINPYVPDSPDRAAIARAAAVRASTLQEIEDFYLAEAAADAAAPRETTPPRDADDVFDLAKWNRRRWI